MLDSVPERELVLSVTSPGFSGSGNANTGFVRVTLVPPSEQEPFAERYCEYGQQKSSKL